jgi:hypothetical protein
VEGAPGEVELEDDNDKELEADAEDDDDGLAMMSKLCVLEVLPCSKM